MCIIKAKKLFLLDFVDEKMYRIKVAQLLISSQMAYEKIFCDKK